MHLIIGVLLTFNRMNDNFDQIYTEKKKIMEEDEVRKKK